MTRGGAFALDVPFSLLSASGGGNRVGEGGVGAKVNFAGCLTGLGWTGLDWQDEKTGEDGS